MNNSINDASIVSSSNFSFASVIESPAIGPNFIDTAAVTGTGARVGDGLPVGTWLVVVVGSIDGSRLGTDDGCIVASWVGIFVGSTDGDIDGTSVHRPQACRH